MKHNTIRKFGASLLVAMGLVTAANAALISGRIDFGGGLTLDSANPATAQAITAFGSVTVSNIPFIPSPTGDYAGTVGAAVTMTPFQFFDNNTNSIVDPSPITAWSFMVGTTNYSFQMTNLDSVSRTNVGVTLSGTGIASIDGYTPTNGTYFLSTQGQGNQGRFSFSANNDVPDGGTTLALLGGSLLGLGAIRRKLVKA